MMRKLVFLLAACCLVACDDGDTKSPGPIEGTVQIEVLDTIDVLIDPRGGDAVSVTVTSHASFGLMPKDTPLEAEGLAETQDETGDTLYSAKLVAPADPSGPCGDEPVSLALSLHRQGENATVLGGISAYCGADTWYGVPARVLRIAGPLPLPK